MRKIGLHWQILIGIIGAVLFGMFLPDYVHYVSWMGTVFIRGLKMIVVPLVLSSLVCGVINIGSNGIGRIGLKALIYYISTSLLAIFTGLIFVNLIKPGAGRGSLLAQHAGAIDLVLLIWCLNH